MTADSTAPEPIVIINRDRAVTHSDVLNVMNQLRQVEGVKLAIATTSPLLPLVFADVN